MRTAARLAYLVDAFLAEEVLDKSTFRPRREAVDVADIVGDICRELAQQSGREIAVTGASVGTIEADPGLIRTASAISSAMRSNIPSVRSASTSWRAPRASRSPVRDDGPGIPEAETHRDLRAFLPIRPDKAQGVEWNGIGSAS